MKSLFALLMVAVLAFTSNASPPDCPEWPETDQVMTTLQELPVMVNTDLIVSLADDCYFYDLLPAFALDTDYLEVPDMDVGNFTGLNYIYNRITLPAFINYYTHSSGGLPYSCIVLQ